MELVITAQSVEKEVEALEKLGLKFYSGLCSGCWVEVWSNEQTTICPRCGGKAELK